MVSTGATEPMRVFPGAPMEPTAVGENPSESQPVGVIANVFCEKTAGASHELARLREVPSAHDVGIRMNLPLEACPLKVSATWVI